MGILRTRTQGVIHLYPTDPDSAPEIEFVGGEGPETVMDRIQGFAVPLIREAIEPMGPYLRWEELDLEAGTLRRHRSSFRDRFEFVLSPDDRGIELLLPGAVGGDRAGGRPWVPLRALAEPPGDQRAALGWSVERPTFSWRYLHTRHTPPTIEMTWSCASLPRTWAQQVLRRRTFLRCRFGDADGGGKICELNPTRDGLLVYQGYYPLPADAGRPAHQHIALEQPLVVLAPDAEDGGCDLDAVGLDAVGLDVVVPATVEALDFRAVLAERTTRLVAASDLAEPFAAEVLTPEDILLPDEIPGGTIPGLPWDLTAESAGIEPRTPDRGTPDRAAEGAAEPLVEPGEAEEGRGLDAVLRRRWILTPRTGAGERGTWDEVAWEGEPPTVGFCLTAGSRTAGPRGAGPRGAGSPDGGSPDGGPRITRIDNRRATVGWQVEASEEDELLCLTVPHWVPVGCPEQVALPPENGFEYASEVRAHLRGIEERFHIDQSSEMSANRVFLGPDSWRFRDELHGELTGGEALGEAAGCVRWRRPADARDRRRTALSPTDWAGGSAPVLLVRPEAENALHWGALYAPETVPWDALEEVPAEPVDPEPEAEADADACADEKVLLVPRSPRSGHPAAAIWIDLWGFVCRYDRRPLAFVDRRGEASELTAWVARTGLELFPRRHGFLLRSFAPIYAVHDPAPRIFSLEPTVPRPTLRIGFELGRGAAPRVLEIGAGTYVRCQLGEADEPEGRTPGGRTPPATFDPGRVPGTPLRLEPRIEGRTVWFALEQRRRGGGRLLGRRPAGYLLSWDAASGWRFRGFFAHTGTLVELGTVRRRSAGPDAGRCRLFLGDETCRGRRAFRLTVDTEGERWSDGTPEEVVRRVTRERIHRWEGHYFARDRRPPPLGDYRMRVLRQPGEERRWVFEFFERDAGAGPAPPLGIRVWEPQEDAPEEALAAGVRTLGEEAAGGSAEPPPEAVAAPPEAGSGPRKLGADDGVEAAEDEPEPPPRKRILRPDDDEDDL